MGIPTRPRGTNRPSTRSRLGLHRVGPRLRLALARRPWIRWGAIVAIALVVGATVHDRLERVDTARAAWTETRSVRVAAGDHLPGDVLMVDTIELPLAAIPASAAPDLDTGTVARQRIAEGEIVVAADVSNGGGPAATADDGTVVVPVSDPLVISTDVGVAVAIYSDGIVLAATGTVVHVDADVVFVAVDPADAPLVAAAAQSRSASIVFPR